MNSTYYSLWLNDVLLQYGEFEVPNETYNDYKINMIVKWFERAVRTVKDKTGDSKILVIFKEPLLQTGISQKQSFNNSLNSVLSFKASSKLLGALVNSSINNDIRYRTITHTKWKEILGLKSKNKFDQIIEAGEIIDDFLEMDIEEESVASVCMGYAYIKTPF